MRPGVCNMAEPLEVVRGGGSEGPIVELRGIVYGVPGHDWAEGVRGQIVLTQEQAEALGAILLNRFVQRAEIPPLREKEITS